jgi:hypothetical protein
MLEFFTFRKMVSPTLIRVVYAAGVILMVLTLLFGLGSSVIGMLAVLIDQGLDGIGAVALMVFWMIGMVIGFLLYNLLWRIFCEGMILMFRMNESLQLIERRGAGVTG